MKKTLLFCTVVFLSLGASAQVKKAAVQSPQPLAVATTVQTDKLTARRNAAENQAKIQLQSELDRKALQATRSSKKN